MSSVTLLERAAEALWEAWMAQHAINHGKEYASMDDLRRYAAAGQLPAKLYLKAIYAEVSAIARVILEEPASEAMKSAYHENMGHFADNDWRKLSAARLAELREKGNE